MIALLDINMLIALFDPAHIHHEVAHRWFEKERSEGWATCPLTQNGCIRVMSQSQYPGHLPLSDAVRRLRIAASAPEHTFWPDSISICDSSRFDATRLLTPKTLKDTYLLGLAQFNGGRLVTFDHGVSLTAVPAANQSNLTVL